LIINNQFASVISGHTRVGTARGVCNRRFLGKFGLRERAKLAWFVYRWEITREIAL